MIVLLSYQFMEILHANDSQNQMKNELLLLNCKKVKVTACFDG